MRGGAAVYVASRASVPERPAMWQRFRAEGYPICSTWIDEAGPGQTASMAELWERIGREVAGSCGVLLYVEASDLPLKGTFVEAGMALAHGLPVAIVAPGVADVRTALGSWVAVASVFGAVEDAAPAGAGGGTMSTILPAGGYFPPSPYWLTGWDATNHRMWRHGDEVDLAAFAGSFYWCIWAPHGDVVEEYKYADEVPVETARDDCDRAIRAWLRLDDPARHPAGETPPEGATPPSGQGLHLPAQLARIREEFECIRWLGNRGDVDSAMLNVQPLAEEVARLRVALADERLRVALWSGAPVEGWDLRPSDRYTRAVGDVALSLYEAVRGQWEWCAYRGPDCLMRASDPDPLVCLRAAEAWLLEVGNG